MAADSQRHAVARRGTKLLAIAMVIAQISALARYTVLARLLGPEQLGLAATLILTAQFFDAVTQNGGDRFLVQSRQGDEPRVQALVHLAAVGRGLVVATLLVVLARPIAAFFREPVVATGLVGLAAMPLIGGFVHYDFRRRQRGHDFRDEAATLSAAELVGLAVTTVAAFVVRDFTAVVYGLVARAATLVLVSHLRADRPYHRLFLAREHAAALWRFSAPLLINGTLLFFGAQSDRLLIGRFGGPIALGLYSAVLLPIFYPSAMLIRFLGALYSPRMAETASEPLAAEDEMRGAVLLAGVGGAVGFTLLGPFAIPFVFGAEFRAEAMLITLVGIYQLIRLIRVAPLTRALGLGASRLVLSANIARLVAIPLAIAGAEIFGGVVPIVAGFALGELFALVFGTIQINREGRKPRHDGLDRIAAFVATSAMLLLLSLGWDRGDPVMLPAGALGLCLALVLVALRERCTIRLLLRQVRL